MPASRRNATKARILFLQRYLYDHTDDENVVTTNDIIAILKEHGFQANRHTVQNDIAVLNDSGFDIITTKGAHSNSYHFGVRTFELPELKMLVDAVASAQFISATKSTSLISKLATLTSRNLAPRLTSKIYTAKRTKTTRNSIFQIMDRISRAIDEKKKITFQYFEYSPTKKKALRHDGEWYINSPYALVWNEDRYYLVGYSDKWQKVVTFRIDRMKMPEIMKDDAVPAQGFDPLDYVDKTIRMYSGKEQTVTLRCKNTRMNNLVDKFGLAFDTREDTAGTFLADVTVETSPTFYGWLFQYAGDIEIVSPEDVRREYKERASLIL
ncbi:MAG: WYL domain-containing protein [Schwartzia sp.]|nr:WYL domain-containing protein [Schwartzia sp. (in: firmicutes)]